jgi:5-methylcytosine-specific restriction protein B
MPSTLESALDPVVAAIIAKGGTGYQWKVADKIVQAHLPGIGAFRFKRAPKGARAANVVKEGGGKPYSLILVTIRPPMTVPAMLTIVKRDLAVSPHINAVVIAERDPAVGWVGRELVLNGPHPNAAAIRAAFPTASLTTLAPAAAPARAAVAGGASPAGAAPPVPAGTDPRVARVCNAFGAALRTANLDYGTFHDDLVRRFVCALATRRFVILTGLSGSGKTRLALAFGQWLGPNRYRVVPVRPDWTGSDALFGYEDVLRPRAAGRPAWNAPDVLRLLLEGSHAPTVPHMLVFDEMNLAHVERYFADVLSGMESQEPCVPNLAREADGEWRVPTAGPSLIRFPSNVFTVGTVNVDETTYSFSPKVLDRATSMEMRVASEDLDPNAKRVTPCAAGAASVISDFLAFASESDYQLKYPHPDGATLASELADLHTALARWNLEFGHRAFADGLRFAALLAAAGETDRSVAIDLMLYQKLLPRLHGSIRQLREPLLWLAAYTFDGTPPPPGAVPDASVLDNEESDAAMSYSFAKTRRMLARLSATQFTSFAE